MKISKYFTLAMSEMKELIYVMDLIFGKVHCIYIKVWYFYISKR